MSSLSRCSVLVVVAGGLGGCAGYIGGDLANVEPSVWLPHCRDTPRQYTLEVSTAAEHDYAGENLAGYISAFTLGLIPTYWLSFETSETNLMENGEVVYSRTDASRIHKFYGLLWAVVLSDNSVNALAADEGAGIRVPEGIRARAVARTMTELPAEITADRICMNDFD